MNILSIITISILVGICIGYGISLLIKPSTKRSPLSDSLAKMIYSTIDTTKEFFDSSVPDKNIEEISELISKGKLKDVEELIKKENKTVEEVNKKINSSSEINKPELVVDNEIKSAVAIIKLQGNIKRLTDNIDILDLTLETMNTDPNVTQEEINKIIEKLTVLRIKLTQMNSQLLTLGLLDVALNKITDPEKLAHIREIQAKILTKRETEKKKIEGDIKNENPKVEAKLVDKIKTKKDKEVEIKKTKIKEEKDD
jgi:hypothetical protein